MDVSNITQIITSLGFPIAAYVGLFWYIIQRDKIHKEESDGFKQAIENNTIIITKLYERLSNNE